MWVQFLLGQGDGAQRYIDGPQLESWAEISRFFAEEGFKEAIIALYNESQFIDKDIPSARTSLYILQTLNLPLRLRDDPDVSRIMEWAERQPIQSYGNDPKYFYRKMTEDGGEPLPYDKYMSPGALIDRLEQELERSGLSDERRDETLHALAQAYAQEMIENRDYSFITTIQHRQWVARGEADVSRFLNYLAEAAGPQLQPKLVASVYPLLDDSMPQIQDFALEVLSYVPVYAYDFLVQIYAEQLIKNPSLLGKVLEILNKPQFSESRGVLLHRMADTLAPGWARRIVKGDDLGDTVAAIDRLRNKPGVIGLWALRVMFYLNAARILHGEAVAFPEFYPALPFAQSDTEGWSIIASGIGLMKAALVAKGQMSVAHEEAVLSGAVTEAGRRAAIIALVPIYAAVIKLGHKVDTSALASLKAPGESTRNRRLAAEALRALSVWSGTKSDPEPPIFFNPGVDSLSGGIDMSFFANDAVSAERVVSSSVTQNDRAPLTAAQKPGGIDFRAMPLPLSELPGIHLNTPVAHLETVQLDQTWSEIKGMVESKVIPPPEKISAYLQACCRNENMADKQVDEILAYVTGILRLEEELSVRTEPVLVEILQVLESGNPARPDLFIDESPI